jgi:alkanesulfonate monooxygenase SsuD/methylene tetrahydromethanopterin reductase-like flavin-dependent oxidoreductase (luciferase family)
MFAYLAGLTERIGLTTGILILPQRQTALVARQAADVDLLSGGRLRLGVGVGWNPVEYEALGQDFRTPAQSIPKWLGGSSEAAFHRAARLADGFIFFSSAVADSIEAWRTLRERVLGEGRLIDDFGAELVVRPDGGMDQLIAEIEAWRQAGGSHVSVVTMGLGLDSIDAHVGCISSVAEALSLH